MNSFKWAAESRLQRWRAICEIRTWLSLGFTVFSRETANIRTMQRFDLHRCDPFRTDRTPVVSPFLV